MGIFNLTDINITTDSERTGVGKKLVGTSAAGVPHAGKYNQNIYRYPLDIGSADKGHYMVFHINVQEESNWESEKTWDRPAIFERNGAPEFYKNVKNSADALGNLVGQTGDIIANFANTVGIGVSDATKNRFNELKDVTGAVVKSFASGRSTRTIQRVTDTIVLYMPDTGITFTNSQGYSEVSLQGTWSTAAAVGGSINDLLKTDISRKELGKAIGNISPFILSNLSESGGAATKALFAAGTGMVQNPMLEMIYSSPTFRTFTFDFMMYPRSRAEGKEMMQLIERFRFHQAPEIQSQYKGFFLIPPSEFDIKFYYNGKENKNIDRISTCVLESIIVDYSPNGYSAYEVPGESEPTIGGTGTPVGIHMTLNFKETQILTKEDYSGAGVRKPNDNKKN